MPDRTRVLLLGAGGGVGAATGKLLCGMNDVSVVLADRDEKALDRLTGAAEEALRLTLDITDPQTLQDALKGADLVLNAVGPYTRFGPLVLEAALEVGTDYADICDDPEPTRTLLGYDERARAAGIRALVGLGASPGISNLLAVRAAATLDDVHTLHTLWNAVDDFEEFGGVDGPIAHGAATVHWMEQLHGLVPAVVDGEVSGTQPLERLSLQLPTFGAVDAYTVGHPEPLTLHRAFPSLRSSRNAMLGDLRLFELLRSFRDRMDAGLSSGDAARLFYGEVSDLTDLAYLRASDGRLLPSLIAFAEGTKDGREMRTVAFCSTLPKGGTAGVTAAPFSLAVPLHADGWTREPGVRSPESAVEPTTFFDLLGAHCSSPPDGDLVSILSDQA